MHRERKWQTAVDVLTQPKIFVYGLWTQLSSIQIVKMVCRKDVKAKFHWLICDATIASLERRKMQNVFGWLANDYSSMNILRCAYSDIQNNPAPTTLIRWCKAQKWQNKHHSCLFFRLPKHFPSSSSSSSIFSATSNWSGSLTLLNKIFSCRPSLFAILKFLLATIKVGSAILLFAALGLNGTTLKGAPFNTLATFYLGVRTWGAADQRDRTPPACGRRE